MKIISDFSLEIGILNREIEKCLVKYPENLQDNAIKIMKKYEFEDNNFKHNPMSHLMAFWLQKELGLSNKLCLDISIGSVMGLFYFMVQDLIMDNHKENYNVNIITLGNLFFVDFVEKFRILLPNNNLFWQKFNEYIRQWAYSVVWEKNNHVDKKNEYVQEDLLLVARKAAPLKIWSTACCILSENDIKIEEIAYIIDLIVITFQMLDDISDWSEDYSSGTCTYFLWLIMKHSKIKDFKSINNKLINETILLNHVLEEIYLIIKKNKEIIDQTGEKYKYLKSYHNCLITELEKVIDQKNRGKKLRYSGGFIKYLERNCCN